MKIYVDAGHGKSDKTGGYDSGAVGRSLGTHEAKIAYEMALRLGHLLREKGHTVVGCNPRDSITESARTANREGCDLVISLHCNSHANRTAHGFEVLYATPAGKSYAQRVHDQVMKDIPTGASQWLKKDGPYPLRSRGLQHRPRLGILRLPHCPAILIEAAFISHPEEELWLRDRDFQQAMMQSVADAIGPTK